MPAKSPWLRLRHGAIFLGGALIYPLLVYGPLGFGWTPVIVALVYVLAVLAGASEGGLWSSVRAVCAHDLSVGAAALAFAGIADLVRGYFEVLDDPGLYAIILGMVGAFNVLVAVGRPRDGGRSPFLD